MARIALDLDPATHERENSEKGNGKLPKRSHAFWTSSSLSHGPCLIDRSLPISMLGSCWVDEWCPDYLLPRSDPKRFWFLFNIQPFWSTMWLSYFEFYRFLCTCFWHGRRRANVCQVFVKIHPNAKKVRQKSRKVSSERGQRRQQLAA